MEPDRKISAAAAIKHADKMIMVPMALATYAVLILGALLALIELLPYWTLLLVIPVAFLFGLYVESRKLYQWQIWALSNVRNVHELKAKGLRAGLFDSWSEKIFPPTSAESFRLENLRLKFGQQDVFIDDQSVPPNVEIFFSKVQNRLQLLTSSVLSVFFTVVVWLFVPEVGLDSGTKIGGFIFFVLIWLVLLSQVVQNFREMYDTRAQMILTNDGLTLKRRFFPRSEIEHIAIWENGKEATLSIKLRYTRIEWKEDISDLDIDKLRLEEIVDTFLQRWINTRAESKREVF